MKLKLFTSVILLLIVSSQILQAQNKPYRVGTTTANFLEMGVGSAGNAMGDAYVSMANDLSSIYWNPAGLAYMDRSETLFMHQPWIADIDVNFAGVGIVVPGMGTLGLAITNMNFGRTEVTTMDMQDGTGETYEANEYAISLSYGRRIVQWFSFGASVKYISSSIWHLSANAAAVDLGVIVNTHFLAPSGKREDGLKIGMSISNYGSKLRYEGMDLLSRIDPLPNENGNYDFVEGQYKVQGWELPLIFRMGLSFNPIVLENQRLTLSVDALHPNNNNESINVGAQYEFKLLGFGTVQLHGGYKGMYMDDSEFGLTMGGAVNMNLMHNTALRVGYAYKDIGILGSTSLYTMAIVF